MTTEPRSVLRHAWALLAVSSLASLAAPITILSDIPDLTTRSSRHAVAGALGLAAMAVLELLIAAIPLRRGEGWALVAALVPFAMVGVPVAIVDAVHVAPANLVRTLAPQVAGIVVWAGSWTLCALHLHRAGRSRRGSERR